MPLSLVEHPLADAGGVGSNPTAEVAEVQGSELCCNRETYRMEFEVVVDSFLEVRREHIG